MKDDLQCSSDGSDPERRAAGLEAEPQFDALLEPTGSTGRLKETCHKTDRGSRVRRSVLA